jgi:hypothetical protein
MFEVGKRAPRITYLHILEQICYGWDKRRVNLIVRDGILHVTIHFPKASVFEKKVYCAKVLTYSGNYNPVKYRSRTVYQGRGIKRLTSLLDDALGCCLLT